MQPRCAQAIRVLAGAAALAVSLRDTGAAQDPSADAPEARAAAFLAVEVPRWAKENACYSCHNNGDAARALMAAVRSRVLEDRGPLDDTLAFLAAPQRWDANGPEGPFKDKKLARIQFAAALVDAQASGLLRDRAALERAAALVAELARDDGSWETDAPGTIGSPATYGRVLSTAMAVRVLAAADRERYASAISKARDWLATREVKNVLEAAATLWALAEVESSAAASQRESCVEIIRLGESAGGGWGPFVNAPPEVFDTALVVVALAAQGDARKFRATIVRGRKYLIARQAADGSWPATTRPSGVDSYAQQLSTTGWATQALLATRSSDTQKGTRHVESRRPERRGR